MRFLSCTAFRRKLGLVLAVLAVSSASCQPREAVTPPTDRAADAKETAPPPVGADLQGGIDVSVHSGSVDWTAVAQAGHSFAFVKATEGIDLKDSAFEDHWRAMKDAGLIRGAYHFYVTEDDPEEQARFFTMNVTLASGDLAPVVDIELLGHGTQPGLPGRLKAYLDLIEEHYGVRPIIYTSPNFWDQHLTDEYGDYPLWIAEYGVDQPRLPSGWQTWHLWQYQADADVPGVEKGADMNRFNAELDSTALFVP